MDINVKIKEEIELEEPSIVLKSEEENEDIPHLDIKTEKNLSTVETQTSSLYLNSVKKASDDDNGYAANTDIIKLKEDFSSSEEKTLSDIKTEELMLKSESKDDDSNTGASWEEARKDYTTTNIHEMLLKNEMLVKHDESAIEEHNCDYSTYGNDNLKVHLISEHNKSHLNSYDESATKKYNCNLCDYKTNDKSCLNRHVLAKHDESDTKKYNCNLCDYKTNIKNHLNSHVFVKHDKSAIRKYNCNFCDYKTNIKNQLNRHVLAKHDESATKKYSCHHCAYKTNDKSCLNRHVLVKHDESATKKYNCIHCDYNTHFRSNFINHVKSKHLMTKYNCNDQQ